MIEGYRDTAGYRDAGIHEYRDIGIQGYKDTLIKGYKISLHSKQPNTNIIIPYPS